MMKLKTNPKSNLDLVKKDVALFQKEKINNRFQVYNFDEEELVAKFELLMIKFDEIFRA